MTTLFDSATTPSGNFTAPAAVYSAGTQIRFWLKVTNELIPGQPTGYPVTVRTYNRRSGPIDTTVEYGATANRNLVGYSCELLFPTVGQSSSVRVVVNDEAPADQLLGSNVTVGSMGISAPLGNGPGTINGVATEPQTVAETYPPTSIGAIATVTSGGADQVLTGLELVDLGRFRIWGVQLILQAQVGNPSVAVSNLRMIAVPEYPGAYALGVAVIPRLFFDAGPYTTAAGDIYAGLLWPTVPTAPFEKVGGVTPKFSKVIQLPFEIEDASLTIAFWADFGSFSGTAKFAAEIVLFGDFAMEL